MRAQTLEHMPDKFDHPIDVAELRLQLREHNIGLGEPCGWLFAHTVIYIDNRGLAHKDGTQNEPVRGGTDSSRIRLHQLTNVLKFGGAQLSDNLNDESITHVIITMADDERDRDMTSMVRSQLKWYVPPLSFARMSNQPTASP